MFQTQTSAVVTPRLQNLATIPGKHSHLCPPTLQDRTPGKGKLLHEAMSFYEFLGLSDIMGKGLQILFHGYV